MIQNREKKEKGAEEKGSQKENKKGLKCVFSLGNSGKRWISKEKMRVKSSCFYAVEITLYGGHFAILAICTNEFGMDLTLKITYALYTILHFIFT